MEKEDGQSRDYFRALSDVYKRQPCGVYGDNVFEKHGINRDRTGDREKTRYL